MLPDSLRRVLNNHDAAVGHLILAGASDAGRLQATFAGPISAAIDANTLVLELKDGAGRRRTAR